MITWVLLTAVANPAELDLKWSGPPQCPSQADVELRVADMVGRSITVGPGAAWSVEAVAAQGPRGWGATVRLRTAGGLETRDLSARACEALADAVAVIVALALDSGDQKAGPPAPGATETATVAAPRPRVVRPRRARAPIPTPRPWHQPRAFSGGLELSTHLGLPDPGVGLAGEAGLRLGRWSLSLGGVLRRSGLAEVAPGQTVQAEGVAGRVRICGRAAQFQPWALDLCANGEAGGLHLTARGRAEGRVWVPWAQVGLEPGLAFELSNDFEGFIRAQVWLALARPQGEVALVLGSVPAFEVPRLTLGFAVGVGADLFVTD